MFSLRSAPGKTKLAAALARLKAKG
jgi:hypothetical protein